MSLEQRLRLLRGEPAPATPVPEAQEPPSLAERLHRLGARGRPEQTKRTDEAGLAEVLGAERIAPGVLRVEHRRALAKPHGRASLADCAAALPDLVDETVGAPEHWLFLDTETSGLAGGTGTWAFLFGAAWIRGGDLVLRQYLLTRLDAEATYLEGVAWELANAELLVTYNGKGFDVPLLATRMRLAGLPAPREGRPHLDLLALVRRAFGRAWPDCRLVTAEARLLRLGRCDDLPGSEAPAAWLDWLRRGATASLAKVLDHNRQDLIALPALIPPLARAFRDPVSSGAELTAVARHHLRRGDPGIAFALLARDPARLDAAGLLDLARLHSRRGNRAAAAAIWESLADRDVPAALEALAKYHEHGAGDYTSALALARRLPAGEARDRRCRRLEQRLAREIGGIPNDFRRRSHGDPSRSGC